MKNLFDVGDIIISKKYPIIIKITEVDLINERYMGEVQSTKEYTPNFLGLCDTFDIIHKNFDFKDYESSNMEEWKDD